MKPVTHKAIPESGAAQFSVLRIVPPQDMANAIENGLWWLDNEEDGGAKIIKNGNLLLLDDADDRKYAGWREHIMTGGVLRVTCGGETKELKAEDVHRGIAMAAQNDNGRLDQIIDNPDAFSAGIVMQFAFFGEVVYG